MRYGIRRCHEHDWAALQQIFLESRKNTYTWEKHTKFNLTDSDAECSGESIWVATTQLGEIVGFISLWDEDEFIHHLYVSDQFKRQGVGRALLTALPAWPNKKYKLKCLTRNENAVLFYKNCGFNIVTLGVAGDGEFYLLEYFPK